MIMKASMVALFATFSVALAGCPDKNSAAESPEASAEPAAAAEAKPAEEVKPAEEAMPAEAVKPVEKAPAAKDEGGW